jgi:hypothetical protein
MRPRRRKPALGQRRNDVREMPVLAFAGEDLVTDDEHADAR